MESNLYVLCLPCDGRITGLTVVLQSAVRAFSDVRAGFRLPLGIWLPLKSKHCTIVLLTGEAFPERRVSSISVYLTRAGTGLLRRCPGGTCLELRFHAAVNTSAGMEIRPRYGYLRKNST